MFDLGPVATGHGGTDRPAEGLGSAGEIGSSMKRRWAGIVGAMVVVGAVGCSSSSSSSSDTTSAPITTVMGADTTVDATTAAAYQKVLDEVRAEGQIPGIIAG